MGNYDTAATSRSLKLLNPAAKLMNTEQILKKKKKSKEKKEEAISHSSATAVPYCALPVRVNNKL